MAGKEPKREFDDYMPDDFRMSDNELDALMAASLSGSAGHVETPLEPGEFVEGTVVGVHDGEIVLEIGRKSHGIIEREEFGKDAPPAVGDRLRAHFVRFDTERGVAMLSIREARRQVFWDSLRAGDVYEGVVVATNKGGLTLDFKGERAFLPISQIERGHVDDLESYVGRVLECEVMSFDKSERDLVVSHRRILDRRHDAERAVAATRFEVGQIVPGTVVRVNEHGAFVDIGGIEGLLHASKIQRRQRESSTQIDISEGTTLQVEIVHVDADAGRIGLDLAPVITDVWADAANEYQPGDEATGLDTRTTPEGAFVLIDEQIEGMIPADALRGREGSIRKGAICKTVIREIDPGSRRIILELQST